jgi:NitT/TauT family transport system permease protein
MIFTRAAVAGTEPRLLDLARALRFSYAESVWKIILPAALPRIFIGFRLSAGLALVVAVTVEVAVNPQGLGALLMTAQDTLKPELMWATLVWIALVGWLLNVVLLQAQQRLFGPAGTLGVRR